MHRRTDRHGEADNNFSQLDAPNKVQFIVHFQPNTQSVNNTSRKFGGISPVSSRSKPCGRQTKVQNVRNLFRIAHNGKLIIKRETSGLEIYIILYYYYYYYYVLFTFMHGIYNYTPETKLFMRYTVLSCSVFTVCATRNAVSTVWYALCLHICSSRSFCAVHSTAGFCNSLMSHFPAMLLSYCLRHYGTVSFASVITGITFASTFLMSWISLIRSLYLKIFSATLLNKFSPLKL